MERQVAEITMSDYVESNCHGVLSFMNDKEFLYEMRMKEIKIEMLKQLNRRLSIFSTQKEAAAYLKTTQPVVSKLANYKVEDISIELILKYLNYFDIDLTVKYIDDTLLSKFD